jgi:uncharacterized membrane protein
VNIISYFTQPVGFFSLLAVFFLLSVLVVVSIAQKDTSEKKGLKEEIKKLKEDLTVKNQMYEGLKGQYGELEKDFEKMSQSDLTAAPQPSKSIEPPKPVTLQPSSQPPPQQSAAQPKPAVSQPPQQSAAQPNPDSITNLLKSLRGSRETASK